jgi:hypothetical protein
VALIRLVSTTRMRKTGSSKMAVTHPPAK